MYEKNENQKFENGEKRNMIRLFTAKSNLPCDCISYFQMNERGNAVQNDKLFSYQLCSTINATIIWFDKTIQQVSETT